VVSQPCQSVRQRAGVETGSGWQARIPGTYPLTPTLEFLCFQQAESLGTFFKDRLLASGKTFCIPEPSEREQSVFALLLDPRSSSSFVVVILDPSHTDFSFHNFQLPGLKFPDSVTVKIRATFAQLDIQRTSDTPNTGIILKASYTPLGKQCPHTTLRDFKKIRYIRNAQKLHQIIPLKRPQTH
jgi:hypothetical protein